MAIENCSVCVHLFEGKGIYLHICVYTDVDEFEKMHKELLLLRTIGSLNWEKKVLILCSPFSPTLQHFLS
jgi:hypothetical protein